MDFNALVQSISTVGFPIIMCLILLYYMKSNSEKHADEVNQLRNAIENNTIVITKLMERIGSDE